MKSVLLIGAIVLTFTLAYRMGYKEAVSDIFYQTMEEAGVGDLRK